MSASPYAHTPDHDREPEPDRPHIAVTLGSELRLAGDAVAWLWEPFLAFGSLSVLDGDPGVGKSLLTLDLAARLSTGRPMPGGAPAPRPLAGRVPVVFVNAEDHVRQTLVPRLLAARGDPGGCIFLGGLGEGGPNGLPVRFPDDLPSLAHLLHRLPGSFVVLDPVMALFPKEVAANHDQSVRAVLTPLARLAAETRSCVLLVRHLTKQAGRALYRGCGSIGIVGACRTGLVIGRHPDDPDRRVLAATKSNLGPAARSLAYRVVEAPPRTVRWPLIPGDTHPLTGEKVMDRTEFDREIAAAPVLAWDGPTPITADDLCAAKPDDGSAVGQAAAWLKKLLGKGPVAATEVERSAEAEGLSYTTVRMAKVRLKVESQRVVTDGQARWEWMLPPDPEGGLGRLPPLGALMSSARRAGTP